MNDLELTECAIKLLVSAGRVDVAERFIRALTAAVERQEAEAGEPKQTWLH